MELPQRSAATPHDGVPKAWTFASNDKTNGRWGAMIVRLISSATRGEQSSRLCISQSTSTWIKSSASCGVGSQ